VRNAIKWPNIYSSNDDFSFVLMILFIGLEYNVIGTNVYIKRRKWTKFFWSQCVYCVIV